MVAMRNFVLLGALGGALAQDGYYASTDRVMGGRSNANVANSDGALRFTGDVNLNGGGFANMVLWWDNGMDLGGFAGIALDFDAVPASEFGDAPIAVQVDLQGGQRCSLTGAFAIPTTSASSASVREFVDFSQLVAKGAWYEYRSGGGVPSSCSGQTTSMGWVNAIEFSIYYQSGPFELTLRNLEVLTTAPPLPEARADGAAGVLAAALARGRSLIRKVGSGVGSAQMHQLAAAAMETAARQVHTEGLAAALDSARNSPITSRTTDLFAALEAEIASPTAAMGGEEEEEEEEAAPPPATTQPPATTKPPTTKPPPEQTIETVTVEGVKWAHIAPGCQMGTNLLFLGQQTLESCAAACEVGDACYGFEYGVDYGGAERDFLAPNECYLQVSPTWAGETYQQCDGVLWNLDLYLRQEEEEVVVVAATTAPPATTMATTAPPATAKPKKVKACRNKRKRCKVQFCHYTKGKKKGKLKAKMRKKCAKTCGVCS